jgi:flagellar assembly protein FliH
MQSAWQRWEMRSIAEELQPDSTRSEPEPWDGTTDRRAARALAPEPWDGITERRAARPPEPVMVDEAELAQLRLQARQAGETEGHEMGYASGLTEGHAAGLAAVQAQAAQLHTLMLALPAALGMAESSVAEDLLALALAIAKKVLGQALAIDPKAILPLVHELLQAEPVLTGAPQLLLHPDDAALVQEHMADDLKAAGWRIRADAHITRGGCRVLATGGERDASLETRWERVAAKLAPTERPVTPAKPSDHD